MAEAGTSPSDMDFVQLYDAFTISELIGDFEGGSGIQVEVTLGADGRFTGGAVENGIVFVSDDVVHFTAQRRKTFNATWDETSAVKLGLDSKGLGNLSGLLNEAWFNLNADGFHTTVRCEHRADAKASPKFTKTVAGEPMRLLDPGDGLVNQVEVAGDKVLDHSLITQHECFDRIVGRVDQMLRTLRIRKLLNGFGDVDAFQCDGSVLVWLTDERVKTD